MLFNKHFLQQLVFRKNPFSKVCNQSEIARYQPNDFEANTWDLFQKHIETINRVNRNNLKTNTHKGRYSNFDQLEEA